MFWIFFLYFSFWWNEVFLVEYNDRCDWTVCYCPFWAKTLCYLTGQHSKKSSCTFLYSKPISLCRYWASRTPPLGIITSKQLCSIVAFPCCIRWLFLCIQGLSPAQFNIVPQNPNGGYNVHESPWIVECSLYSSLHCYFIDNIIRLRRATRGE